MIPSRLTGSTSFEIGDLVEFRALDGPRRGRLFEWQTRGRVGRVWVASEGCVYLVYRFQVSRVLVSSRIVVDDGRRFAP